ncbi:MAG: hypothetical protein IAF38_08410 [Bacteroidia bacterium]|nr:hypothetical protein [Bacteroidia bacterium]
MRKLFCFVYIFLSFYACVWAQTIDTNGIVPVFHKKFVIHHKKKHVNADTLVSVITNGKTGDKEKFDAIFSWVASNIIYDYREYFSAGSPPKNVQRILDERRAICLGYATLMDTLCAKAGITNVSVYGYTKDFIFDLNDSIYMDNHAWNAVKLDGQWFVYDVTWSTGTPKYTLKRFSKFKLKLKEKYKPKYKNKKVWIKTRNTNECQQPLFSPITYQKQRFFNMLWGAFILSRKLRGKYLFHQNVKADYYLSQPEVFGIQHFSDDPIWNLQPGKTLKQFTADSAFYHLHDSVYKQQVRRGSDCAGCDNFVAKIRPDQLAALRKSAEETNKQNHFILGECDFEMGQLLLMDQLSESDDSLKWKKITGGEKKFSLSSSDYKIAVREAKEETVFQRDKNRNKVVTLNRENRAHKAVIEQQKKLTGIKLRKYNEIFAKSYALPNKYRKKMHRERQFGSNMSEPKPGTNAGKTIERLSKAREKAETEIDSIQKIIVAYRNEFDSLITNLSLNTEQKTKILDSMIKMLYLRSNRRAFILDDRKKPVVELKRKIDLFEKDNAFQVEKQIFDPAEKGNFLFTEIARLVKIKQKKQEDCIKHTYNLIKNGEGSRPDLQVYKSPMLANQQEDICWLVINRQDVERTKRGLNSMTKKHVNVVKAIRWENKTERLRSFYISKELRRRHHKYNGIAKGNIRLIKLKLKYLKIQRKMTEKRIREKLKPKKTK